MLLRGVGGLLVRLLAASGQKVRAMVRRPVPPGTFPTAVSTVVADFADPASLDKAMAGVDQLFFVCLPEPAPALLVKHGNVVTAAAARAGVAHTVYLSLLNASPDSGFPQGRWHADTEDRIDTAGLARTFLRAEAGHGSSRRSRCSIRAGRGRRAAICRSSCDSVSPRSMSQPCPLLPEWLS